MTVDYTTLAVAGLAGALLGFCYFGGLWLTVRRIIGSAQPALWLAVSFGLRSLVVVGGLYLISANGWLPLMAAMIGFWVMRTVWVRRLRPEAANPDRARRV